MKVTKEGCTIFEEGKEPTSNHCVGSHGHIHSERSMISLLQRRPVAVRLSSCYSLYDLLSSHGRPL